MKNREKAYKIMNLVNLLFITLLEKELKEDAKKKPIEKQNDIWIVKGGEL